MNDLMEQSLRQEAVAYIRHAIALCDRAGELIAACHLQLSVDILDSETCLEDWNAALARSGNI